MKKVKFILILCDESTNSSVIGREVVYAKYTDQETFTPCLQFFECIAPKDSQNVSGLKHSIKNAFKEHNLEFLTAQNGVFFGKL